MKRFLSIKIILLICLLGAMAYLIGCTPSVSVHTGTISGVVSLSCPENWICEEGFFMPGAARIEILDTGQFTISSFSDGNYILSNVSAGQHTIKIFKHGCITAQQTVNVVEGQTTANVDFILEYEVPNSNQWGLVKYLCFNLNSPPFDNLKVRQALNYAIDKQTLIDEFNTEFNSIAEVAQGPIPPNMIGYNPNLIGYSYDVAEAQALLSQAGYPNGFNTDLYFRDFSGYRFIAEKIKTYLAQIGINVEIHGIDSIPEFVILLDEGEVPSIILPWYPDTPDPADFLYALYHSAGPDNYSHYQNPVVDSQIEQAWETIDEADFVQLIQQIEATIVDDAPAIYMYHY